MIIVIQQYRKELHIAAKNSCTFKSVFPNFTGLDFPLETNDGGSCNAYYNGSSINFYAEGEVVPLQLNYLMLFITSMVMLSTDGDMDLECKMEVKMKVMQIYVIF